MSPFPHPGTYDSWQPPLLRIEARRIPPRLAQRQTLSLKELAGSSCLLRTAASRSSRNYPTLQTETAQTVNDLSLDSHLSKNLSPKQTPSIKQNPSIKSLDNAPRRAAVTCGRAARRLRLTDIPLRPDQTNPPRSKQPPSIKTTPLLSPLR